MIRLAPLAAALSAGTPPHHLPTTLLLRLLRFLCDEASEGPAVRRSHP